MKIALVILILVVAAGGYFFWTAGEAKREIKLQREAMTKARSFRTRVIASNDRLYQGYEGEVICPDKLHFTLHSMASGPIADGTEYIKFGDVAYMKAPLGDWTF